MSTDHSLKRILLLVHGDKATVKRLVLDSISKHPKQAAQWHLEKVIWHLERDRL